MRTQLKLQRVRARLRDQNSSLEAEVGRRMAQNERTQEVAIRALAHLAETRDPETGNHILRTQAYVRLLGTCLRVYPRFSALTVRDIELLARSAPLHDIGKVGIPDTILHKPGALTPDEWEIMKTHAWLGSRAIEQAEHDAAQHDEFLAVAKEISHWHHERWDGSGYPDGLAGEAIPLSARIMALADVFDALVTPRVYKAAMSYPDSLDVIMAGRGKHFDPDIVDAFIGHFDAFCRIADQHRDPLPTRAS